MAKTYKFRCGDFTEIYESDSDEDAREVLNGRVLNVADCDMMEVD